MTTPDDLTILDCTLRDGGYYNHWDFDPFLARRLVAALARSGIDLVELGYKSPDNSRYFGLFKYCPDDQLEYLREFEGPEYAFMVDAKEFICEGTFDPTLADACIQPAAGSVFSWCRIATHAVNLRPAVDLARHLHAQGYRIGFNLMGMSLLRDEQVAEALSIVADAPIRVFYFADSFGSLGPDDVQRTVTFIRQRYGGAIGFHAHENQGLAFANALAALNAGASFIDGTVTGMGRGAGNLRLEQLLLALYFRSDRRDLDPSALLDIIHQDFEPMRREHGWGWDFTYMLSGLENIHPSYAQALRGDHRYTLGQVARILSEIAPEQRSSYQRDELERSRSKVLGSETAAAGRARLSAQYRIPTAPQALIVAGGSSTERHREAIRSFARRESPFLLDCNATPVLEGIRRTVVILNRVRFQEILDRGALEDPSVEQVVLGFSDLPVTVRDERFRFLPTEVRAREFVPDEEGRVVLPSYVVGMLATAIALRARPQRVWFAGFDGFDDPAMRLQHQEMEEFWHLLSHETSSASVEMASLLATRYDLPERSIYSLL